MEAAAFHARKLVGVPGGLALGGHAADDVDQGVEPGADGLQVFEGVVEALHGLVFAGGNRGRGVFFPVEALGEVGLQRVRRVGQDEGVGGRLAVFHQEGLGEQGDEAALAVGDEGDGLGHVLVVVADHRHQGGQALGGEHEVHPPGATAQGAVGIAGAHLEEFVDPGRRSPVPHVGEVGGGVGEGAAALAAVEVETVVEVVHQLAVDVPVSV